MAAIDVAQNENIRSVVQQYIDEVIKVMCTIETTSTHHK